MKAIKKALIDWVDSLSSQALNEVSSTLKQQDVHIPDDEEGKREACLFVKLLFCSYPHLMTDANKKKVEQFSQEIGLSATPQATESIHASRKK